MVERYTYDPYGKVKILAPDGVTIRTSSAVGNPWTFTGRRLDSESGLMYYRARYYDGISDGPTGHYVSGDDSNSLPSGYQHLNDDGSLSNPNTPYSNPVAPQNR